MVTLANRGYRARLAVELADRDRQDIEAWLGQQFDPECVELVTGRRLMVVISELSGRDPKQLGRQLEKISDLRPRSLLLRPGAELEARPSRGRPQLFFLPFDARGPLLAALSDFGECVVPGARSMVRRRAARLFMRVAETRPAAGPGELQSLPSRWPGEVLATLRRPMDAVRLAVYPSQTTSESRELNPLAQVELPIGQR